MSDRFGRRVGRAAVPYKVNDKPRIFSSDNDSNSDDAESAPLSAAELKSRQIAENRLLKSYARKVEELEKKVTALERRYAPRQGPMADLLFEMLYEIFSSLTQSDQLTCELVCKKWYRANIEWKSDISLVHQANNVTNSSVVTICKYRNLSSLSLARCKEVTLPALHTICFFLAHLKELDLFSCVIKDFTCLSMLKSLDALHLGGVDGLTEEHLKTIPSHVKHLRLSWLPAIVQEGVASLTQLTSLDSLILEQNDFMVASCFVFPPNLSTLRKLSIIRQGWYDDTALVNLALLSNLEELDLYWVPVGGQGFKALEGKLPKLRTLKLRRMHNLSGDALRWISYAFPNLETMHFTGLHRIDEANMRHLNCFTRLKSLTLRCGQLITDDRPEPGLSFLEGLSLTSLRLIDCVFIGPRSMQALAKHLATTLTELHLEGFSTLLQRYDLCALRSLKRLESLTIEHCAAFTNDSFRVVYLDGGGINIEIAPLKFVFSKSKGSPTS